jgi:alkanesulfonate monooxygenase SsuD/methylene tetrahydromethanopterin reductase-like flavin-dependent oxidoreductase (luciferase family)
VSALGSGFEFGLGLITCQHVAGDPRSVTEVYNDAIEVAVAAEAHGFDSVWLSEHHFFDDSHLPALIPMAAAIAARTSRIKIGTAVLLAPLAVSAVRLAEEIATVDVLSGGRFILGLGAGWREEEFRLYDVPIAERHRRLWETVRVLREAWGPPGEGPYAIVTPKPVQPGGPPIWIGAGGELTLRRVGRRADGFIGNYYATPDAFGAQVALCRETLVERRPEDAASFTVTFQIPTFAYTDPDDWGRVRESLNHYLFKYDQHAEERRNADGAPIEPPPITTERDEFLRRQGLFGTPQEVAAMIERYREAAGGQLHFIARMYMPGLAQSAQLAAIETFADQVMPALRRPGQSGRRTV